MKFVKNSYPVEGTPVAVVLTLRNCQFSTPDLQNQFYIVLAQPKSLVMYPCSLFFYTHVHTFSSLKVRGVRGVLFIASVCYPWLLASAPSVYRVAVCPVVRTSPSGGHVGGSQCATRTRLCTRSSLAFAVSLPCVALAIFPHAGNTQMGPERCFRQLWLGPRSATSRVAVGLHFLIWKCGHDSVRGDCKG